MGVYVWAEKAHRWYTRLALVPLSANMATDITLVTLRIHLGGIGRGPLKQLQERQCLHIVGKLGLLGLPWPCLGRVSLMN